MDELLGGGFDTKDWEQYEEHLHDMYLIILLQNLNGFFEGLGKSDFIKDFPRFIGNIHKDLFWNYGRRCREYHKKDTHF